MRLVKCLDGLAFVQDAVGNLSAPGTMAVPAAPDALAGAPLGDFRLLREIGRGGMGVVYEAEQISLGRRVALKVLRFAATMDARQLQRFRNESHAAAQLHHTNIVPVYAVGCERSVHFYAMQYIEGHSLAEVIAELRGQADGTPTKPPPSPSPLTDATVDVPAGQKIEPSSPTAAAATKPIAALTTVCSTKDAAYFRIVAQFGTQAAEALDYAHQQGIVHRDIKPANLMVDDQSRVWVTDFGLAQVQGDARLTMIGDLVGTLRYMSPEQALAKRVIVDHRTDIYSLGATLYELLTLEPTFGGNDRQELLRQIAFEEPLPPRRRSKAVPAELETIVLKALEKDPADRYATCQELAEDLQRYLKDEPIRARRPTLVQRARKKWGRRHQSGVWAAAVFSAVLIAFLGSGIGWYFHDRSTRQAVVAARVNDALDESGRLYGEGKVPEALNAARRAAGLLEDGLADDPLAARVQERVQDLKTVLKLDEAIFTVFLDRTAEYERLFREYGIDLSVLSVEEAAARIRGRFIAMDLAVALDIGLWGGDDAFRRKLLAVARQADPDPWRDRARQANERGDKAALEELGRTAPIAELPLATLRVIAAKLRGQYPEGSSDQPARDFLRRAQRRYSGDVWLNHLLGDSLSQGIPRDYHEATGFFRVLVALRPTSPVMHHYLGNMMNDSGKLDDAIAYYRKAVELDPKFSRSSIGLADALQRKGLTDEANATLRKAIALKPENMTLRFDLAQALARHGLTDEAIATLRQAIAHKPDDPKTHMSAGFAFGNLGRPDEAITEYKESLRLEPDSSKAHNNIGVALTRKGKLDEAIAAYREALRLKKDYVPAHLNLGLALRDKGQLDEAITEYKEALRLQPDNANAHNNLGLALRDKGQLDEAITEYKEALRLQPDNANAHNNLGSVLARKGRLDEAIAEYKEVLRLYREILRLKPDSADAHNGMAWLLATCPDPKFRDAPRAVTLAKKSVELKPKEGNSWNTLGVAHYRAGDWKAAIEALNKSEALLTGKFLGFNAFFLAMAHWQLGEKDKAREWYAKAVAWMEKNQPRDEELKRFRAEAEELLGIKEAEPELVPLPREVR